MEKIRSYFSLTEARSHKGCFYHEGSQNLFFFSIEIMFRAACPLCPHRPLCPLLIAVHEDKDDIEDIITNRGHRGLCAKIKFLFCRYCGCCRRRLVADGHDQPPGGAWGGCMKFVIRFLIILYKNGNKYHKITTEINATIPMTIASNVSIEGG